MWVNHPKTGHPHSPPPPPPPPPKKKVDETSLNLCLVSIQISSAKHSPGLPDFKCWLHKNHHNYIYVIMFLVSRFNKRIKRCKNHVECWPVPCDAVFHSVSKNQLSRLEESAMKSPPITLVSSPSMTDDLLSGKEIFSNTPEVGCLPDHGCFFHTELPVEHERIIQNNLIRKLVSLAPLHCCLLLPVPHDHHPTPPLPQRIR